MNGERSRSTSSIAPGMRAGSARSSSQTPGFSSNVRTALPSSTVVVTWPASSSNIEKLAASSSSSIRPSTSVVTSAEIRSSRGSARRARQAFQK